jgi:hypothetical protein
MVCGDRLGHDVPLGAPGGRERVTLERGSSNVGRRQLRVGQRDDGRPGSMDDEISGLIVPGRCRGDHDTGHHKGLPAASQPGSRSEAPGPHLHQLNLMRELMLLATRQLRETGQRRLQVIELAVVGAHTDHPQAKYTFV